MPIGSNDATHKWMLVFGDHIRACDPRRVLREIRTILAITESLPAGIARHSKLVGALIEAGELAQALEDSDARAAGVDERGVRGAMAMQLVDAIARDVIDSWSTGFTSVPHVPEALAVLERAILPAYVQMRRAEGFACYAVYPEAYLLAARRAMRTAPGPRRVIGIRTIGATLAPIVAAEVGAPVPATVRPIGEPFRHEVRVSPELSSEWAPDPELTFAIVDEGPGMSGSSFGAVADALEAHGITRIEMYPSHPGALDPIALPRHRERWRRVPRHVVDVDQLLLHGDKPHSLAGWISDVVAPIDGPLIAPLEDVSAGRWRKHRFTGEHAWPPSVTFQERRKFLARTESRTWLAKFVGLGRTGTRAVERARMLSAAELGPEVAGTCHGFLVQRWHADARTLEPARRDRTYLVSRIGRYLGFRARTFLTTERGAPLPRLLEMARHNTALALGERAAELVARDPSWLAARDAAVRPIEIDGRMHAWEWIECADGRLLKTDAVDHHAAHDLVGCQDITWDLVGAEIELDLDAGTCELLRTLVEHEVDRTFEVGMLRLMRICYLAFQLGRHHIAIDAVDSAEAVRLRAAVDRYARRLSVALDAR